MPSAVPPALLLTVALVATPAFAYPPCEQEPGEADVKAAKGLHEAAEAHFAERRFTEAVSAWRRAYAFDCTAHRILINIGNAQAERGRYEEAAAAYRAYLDRTEDTEDAEEVEAKLERAREAEDEGAPAPSPEPTRTAPTPPPDDPRAEPAAWPLVTLGAGGVTALVGTVLLGLGIDGERTANATCELEPDCPGPVMDDARRGIALQQAGGTATALGLAAMAVGLLGERLTTWERDDVALRAGPGTAGLRVRF